MATEYKYNAKTGKWSKVETKTSSTSTNKDNAKGSTSSKKVSTNDSSNLNASNPDKNSSSGSVSKKANEIEIRTLEGSLVYIANASTIKINAGDTIKLSGLGKHLSGNYYVQDVTRSVDNNSGYSHSATVIKTNFGKSLVTSTKNSKKSTSKTKSTKVASTNSSKGSVRTYKVKKGDTLKSISKKFYGNTKYYTRITKANNITKIKVGQTIKVP